MAGRRVEYEERDYYQPPPSRPVQVAERPAPVRPRDLEDLYRRPADGRDRQVAFLRDDYGPGEQQPLVLRERKVETFQRPIRYRSPSVEHVRTRYVERSPSLERERERTRVRYVDDSSRSPSLERDRTRVEVVERQWERSPEPEIYRRERYVERERERERSPSPLYDREKIRTTTRTVERGRERSPSPLPQRDRTSIRVVHRERERRRSVSSSSASSVRGSPVEPPIIRAPPIHQEIITHHRHIDHGFDYQPIVAPTPPPPQRIRTPLPPPPRVRQEVRETAIDIHTGRGDADIDIRRTKREPSRERRRDFYDDDVLYERERERERLKARTSMQRSVSVSRNASHFHAHSHERERERDRGMPGMWPHESEVDYYARKTAERAYVGEAYNGATKKWEIIDVPPGTQRVKMDGVGGGSQEITWQKYNGVRRSKFIPERDSMGSYDRERERGRGRDDDRVDVSNRLEISISDDRRAGRPMPPPMPTRNRYGDMWTEITKDLVIREAIEELGYDYEETEYFFYVFQYLRYDDVVELVDLSTDIRRDKRHRAHEIAWEREHPRPREREREMLMVESSRERIETAYDDDRIIEREVIYDSPRRATRIYY